MEPVVKNPFKSICVFCGSSKGSSEKYAKAAWETGKVLAEQNITLVFGGGQVGLMGVVADSVLKHGGKAIGVIPGFLAKKEIAHAGLTTMHVVETMHQRKQMMADLSDGFIALPGGMGTLEELCEVLTWAQLGLHNKPFGLLNVKSYYRPLVKFFEKTVEESFSLQENRDRVLIHKTPSKLVSMMAKYEAPARPQWLDRAHT